MCMGVYLAADRPLPLVEWREARPSVNVAELSEAEAQVRGRYEGTVKVSPLCEGLLEVRYKIEQ